MVNHKAQQCLVSSHEGEVKQGKPVPIYSIHIHMSLMLQDTACFFYLLLFHCRAQRLHENNNVLMRATRR